MEQPSKDFQRGYSAGVSNSAWMLISRRSWWDYAFTMFLAFWAGAAIAALI